MRPTWFAVAGAGALGLLGGCGGELRSDDLTKPGDGGPRKDVVTTSSSQANASSTTWSSASVGVSSSSGWRGSSGAWSRSSSRVGSSSSSASGECYQVATVTYPEDGGAMYCPFSAVADGGASRYCTHGGHCCETPESAGTPSTCEDGGLTCPVVASTDWQCEGTPDCAGGQVCCGAGKVENQPAQPGCAPGGGTVPPSIYVSGFTPGSTCAASCAGVGSGVPWQICSQTSECPSGQTCVPVLIKGNSVGACCTGSPGSWTCSWGAAGAVECAEVTGTGSTQTCTFVESNTPGFTCPAQYVSNLMPLREPLRLLRRHANDGELHDHRRRLLLRLDHRRRRKDGLHRHQRGVADDGSVTLSRSRGAPPRDSREIPYSRSGWLTASRPVITCSLPGDG